jgi:hypothetical protein
MRAMCTLVIDGIASGVEGALCHRAHFTEVAPHRVFFSWLRSQIWLLIKKKLATDYNEGSLVAKSCSQAKFFTA